MNRNQFALFYLIPLLSFSSAHQILGEDKPAPLPSGPQTDGLFRKVILEADRDVNGDGKIDLLMNLSDHYNVNEMTLLLSLKRPRGSLVEKVAVFRTTGC